MTTQANIFTSEAFIRTSTTSTTTTAATTTTTPRTMFRGGQRRGMIKKQGGRPGDDSDDDVTRHNEVGHGGSGYVDSFTKKICVQLKVPCRFVSDHMCCKYRMPLDLVARARSMDGSADLKWRSNQVENGQKDSHPSRLKPKFQVSNRPTFTVCYNRTSI